MGPRWPGQQQGLPLAAKPPPCISCLSSTPRVESQVHDHVSDSAILSLPPFPMPPWKPLAHSYWPGWGGTPSEAGIDREPSSLHLCQLANFGLTTCPLSAILFSLIRRGGS